MSTATVNAQEQSILDRVPTQLYIGGEWRDATGGGTLPVEDPATGETIAEVADATVEDAMSALDAAVAAQAEFAATPPRERSEILRRAYEALVAQARRPRAADDDGDGQVRHRVQGRDPLRRRLLQLVRRRGAAHRRPLQGQRQGHRPRASSCASRSGRACSSRPWNFPMAMGTRKIGPAIAAGCTIGHQAGQADAAVDAHARQDPRGGRASGRRAERRHGEVQRQDDRSR